MNCWRLSRQSVILYVAVLVGLSLLIAVPVAATPPTDIGLAYNVATGQLNATITHPVPNPDVHYIKNVLVKLNDQVVINASYTSQPTHDTFTYTYSLPAKAGDTISVTATCVLFGSLTRNMTVPLPGPASSSEPSAPLPVTTPKAAAGLLSLEGAIVLGFVVKKMV